LETPQHLLWLSRIYQFPTEISSIGRVSQAWSVAKPLRAYIEDNNTEKNTTQTKKLENTFGKRN